MNYDLPETEQGQLDFIRFATAEIKRCELKIKKLNESINMCDELLLKKGKINAQHFEALQIS